MPLLPLSETRASMETDSSLDEKEPSRPSYSNRPQANSSIRIRNRRKAYLDKNPNYFSSELELADPLLYDRLVRRFQSASEREAEGRAKGYSGVLEADLFRSEAKMHALAHPDQSILPKYSRGPNNEILAEDADDLPTSKKEAYAEWRKAMEMRFINGNDHDFDYTTVDNDEELDESPEARQEEEERYYAEEQPSWALDSDDEGQDGSGGRQLTGETGIQDY